MKKYVLVFVVLGIVGSLVIANKHVDTKISSSQPSSKPCIPTFPDGDGPYYQKESPFRDKLVPQNNNGQKMLVTGKVLQSDCQTALPNVVLDIWQADETGKYQDEWYRGRVKTDEKGNYQFETVMPKGYGEGTGYRPPHIHFKVWEGEKLLITSEMFFPEVRGKPGFNDAYIVTLEEKNVFGNKTLHATHNIIVP